MLEISPSPLTISIVIPSYNPQERILARVLSAVGVLMTRDQGGIECVIVDNRSSPPVADLPCVRAFLSANSCARVVREETQGLTYARLAGIRATSGDVVVVFDDDNVPAPSFVNVVRTCIEKYPSVGVWGPGVIDVELLDPVPAGMDRRLRELFAQRNTRFVEYRMCSCVMAAVLSDWHWPGDPPRHRRKL